MKSTIAIIAIVMFPVMSLWATQTETVDGITWSYEKKWDGHDYVEIYNFYPSNGRYYSAIDTSTTGAITVPSALGGATVRHIGQSAFLGCSGITSITIPDRITLDDRAFSGCSGLADTDGFVIIRDTLYEYVGSAPDVIVPNNVIIGGFAFCDHDNLESVIISDGIKNIGVSSFSGCKRLAQVTIPNSVTNIGETAFFDCNGLTSVTVPQCACLKTMAAIFPAYQSITNVIVADGVSTIGAECFSGCESLQSITLPQSVTSIREMAFKDCISLKSVRFLGNAPDAEENIFQGTPRTLTVQVEGNSIGWSGGVSTALPASWCDRAIAYADGSGSGGSGQTAPIQSVITNFVYTTVTNEVRHYITVTNCIFTTVTNEVFHYSTVTNEIFHYTTVTNVVKYVPEPGTCPDAGYGINVGVGGETVIAGAAGWDAFGVPDGMEWDKETGTLSGRAKLSGAYDLILVSGSGADTKIMRTTLTVAPYDTIVGYVGVAFSQSGAPLDNLKSYKTLPAGLKWKSGKLSGVPTKKQTVKLATKDGEPVTIEIRALPTAAVGSFSGAVMAGGGEAEEDGHAGRVTLPMGRATLNVTTAGKISGKIYEGGRTWTLSAANFSSASVPTNGEFRVSGTATRTANKKTYKQKWSLVIAVDGGRGATALPGEDGHAGRVTLPGATIATGTFGDTMTFEAQRNFWKDEGAGELIADWVGEYAWTAPDGGKLTLALNVAGAVKVTGKLGNGRALSLSLPLAYRNDTREVLIYAAPATAKVKSGGKTVTKKYPEFIAKVKLVNEPGMSEAGGDSAYRYR